MKIKLFSFTFIFKIFIFIGVVLSILNFLNERSLWLDEAKLALNIIEKPIVKLIQPLDHEQVAPIGFLIIEKSVSSFFNYSEWSLRLIPLLSFFISIFLIYSITYKLIKDKELSLFTAAFFSTNSSLLYYSSEVKQYSTDVLITLLIISTTISFIKINKRIHIIFFALLGAISIWFSNIATIVLFSVGLSILYEFIKRKKSILKTFPIFFCWLASFFIYFLLFVHNHPTESFMVDYWNNAGGFIPKSIFSLGFCKVVVLKILLVFKLFGDSYTSYLILPLLIFGIVLLWKKNKTILFLTIFPIVTHLILSYFKIYPFSFRLILYLVPFILILSMYGISYITTPLKQKFKNIYSIFLVLILACNLIQINNNGFPLEKEEIKKSLSYLDLNIIEGENIYVYHSAQIAFEFYKNEYPKVSNIDSMNITKGTNNRENWKNHENKIKKINNSTWILFSHIYQDEEDFIIDLFKKNNFQITDQKKFKGSSIYKAIPY